MERLPTISAVKTQAPATLMLVWSNGMTAHLNVSDLLKKTAYKQLANANVFAQVTIGDWGHSVVWPDDIELGADSLWRQTLIAAGQQHTVDFMDWRLRHGLSLSAAAEALGVSRRSVAYYASGQRAVPKTVLLACRGWEANHAA